MKARLTIDLTARTIATGGTVLALREVVDVVLQGLPSGTDVDDLVVRVMDVNRRTLASASGFTASAPGEATAEMPLDDVNLLELCGRWPRHRQSQQFRTVLYGGIQELFTGYCTIINNPYREGMAVPQEAPTAP